MQAWIRHHSHTWRNIYTESEKWFDMQNALRLGNMTKSPALRPAAVKKGWARTSGTSRASKISGTSRTSGTSLELYSWCIAPMQRSAVMFNGVIIHSVQRALTWRRRSEEERFTLALAWHRWSRALWVSVSRALVKQSAQRQRLVWSCQRKALNASMALGELSAQLSQRCTELEWRCWMHCWRCPTV